jgi:hypothetical protein
MQLDEKERERKYMWIAREPTEQESNLARFADLLMNDMVMLGVPDTWLDDIAYDNSSDLTYVRMDQPANTSRYLLPYPYDPGAMPVIVPTFGNETESEIQRHVDRFSLVVDERFVRYLEKIRERQLQLNRMRRFRASVSQRSRRSRVAVPQVHLGTRSHTLRPRSERAETMQRETQQNRARIAVENAARDRLNQRVRSAQLVEDTRRNIGGEIYEKARISKDLTNQIREFRNSQYTNDYPSRRIIRMEEANNMQIFDPISLETTTIGVYLNGDGEEHQRDTRDIYNIVFMYEEENKSVSWKLSNLIDVINARQIVECPEMGNGAPRLSNVKFADWYSMCIGEYVLGLRTLLVPAIFGMFKDGVRIFKLSDRKTIRYTSSVESIMTKPSRGTGIYEQSVNLVSADHCQEGTSKIVFDNVEAVNPPGRLGRAIKMWENVAQPFGRQKWKRFDRKQEPNEPESDEIDEQMEVSANERDDQIEPNANERETKLLEAIDNAESLYRSAREVIAPIMSSLRPFPYTLPGEDNERDMTKDLLESLSDAHGKIQHFVIDSLRGRETDQISLMQVLNNLDQLLIVANIVPRSNNLFYVVLVHRAVLRAWFEIATMHLH